MSIKRGLPLMPTAHPSRRLGPVIIRPAVSGFLFTFLFASILFGQLKEPPFRVDSLFDFRQPQTLGLPPVAGAETITIFSPHKGDTKYNHAVVLYPFKGTLYAQWQTSALDEDAPDTHVLVSHSVDGEKWSTPVAFTDSTYASPTSSGGWWSKGDSLVAYVNVWSNTGSGLREGRTEYRLSADGVHWSPMLGVIMKDGMPVPGVIEQGVHALPGGRIITAFHLQPGLIATPFYTDDPLGITGWTAGKMAHLPAADKRSSREIEPGWFRRRDGALVMVFRDQQGTFRQLASVSRDSGVTWGRPQIVDMPDSRSKQCAGNLPDGTAYMVNNPSGSKDRFPLVITLSKDGFLFDRAYLLRSGGKGLQPMRFKGRFKRAGYSYPKSVVWGGYLYVSYATNKEDVEITRIPIGSLTPAE